MASCYFCYKEVADDGNYHSKCCKKFFGTDRLPDLKLDTKLMDQLAEQTVNKRISLTGVQPKLSLDLENIPTGKRLTIVGLWGKFILKPQNAEIPYMPEVEDLTMHLAKSFKIKTCDHCLIPVADGKLAYIAKRLDRQGKSKIHMEDFCQLGGFQTEQKYDGSYERCGKLINEYCTNKGLDILNYFELLVFSFLSGNSDMHMKNFSIIYLGDQILLSPAYDLINSALVYPQDRDEMALLLSGRKRNIKMRDFQNLAGSLGLTATVFQRVMKKFTNTPDSFFDTVANSFLSEAFKQEYIRIWQSRLAQLKS